MKNVLKFQSETFEKIEQAIEYIDENFKDKPTLEEIATSVGLSKFHFTRLFKEYVGVTAMQFLQAVTLEYAKKQLIHSKTLLDATLQSGLSSSSRLHELFINFEGVTPKEYKEFGQNLKITYGYGFSPFGKTLLAFSDKGICYMEFCNEKDEAALLNFEKHWINAKKTQKDELIQKKLDDIFVDNKSYNIFVKGTNFQISVWRALLNIPDGMVTTYQNIADSIQKPKAVRAVASAIGSNHVAYLIPCHRVIGKTGAMSGYRWGISRKKILLAYEGLKNTLSS